MNTKTCTITLSLLAGACALAMPALSHAANVGYYGQCYGGTPAAQITAAGHTPVAIASAPNAANLAGISLLFAESCGSLTDPGVAGAVASGMTLIVHDPSLGGTWSNLPGAPALTPAAGSTYGVDIDFTASAGYLSGPGGILTNTSLDGGNWSNHGSVAVASLPAGSVVSATTAVASQVVTFSYPYGSGRVIFSTIPLQCYLPGGNCISSPVAPEMQKYATNLIATSLGYVSTTCASEGYIGAKLTWCKNICENGLTGKVLDTWIHRWIMQFRDLPYCARATTPPPPPPPPPPAG